MSKPLSLFATWAALLALGLPAQAGMGASFPKYHPAPCQGGDCRGDDEKSGMPCQGLLCTFSSAKSLQKPMTASEAAEAQARATAAQAASPVPPPAPAPEPARKKRKATTKSAKVKSSSGQSSETEKKSAAADIKRDEAR